MGVGGHCWPQEHNLNKLGRGSTTFQRPCCFRQVDENMFSYLAYVKHVTSGRAHLRPKGYNLNKIGRAPLDDAKYQISIL